MGVAEDFELAAAAAKDLPESISNEDKLALYGLYKQSTAADISTDRPGMFDQKGRAKWDAWKSHAGALRSKRSLSLTGKRAQRTSQTSEICAIYKYMPNIYSFHRLVEDLKAKYSA